MPTVYRTQSGDRRVRFHRFPTCRRTRGSVLSPVELDDVEIPVPCLECYPDAPRPISAHRYCPTCNVSSVRPCAHNGGVRVLMTRVRRTTRMTHEAGEPYVRFDYVWPESVFRLISA